MSPMLFEVIIRSLKINNQHIKLGIKILWRKLEIKHFGFTPLSDILSYIQFILLWWTFSGKDIFAMKMR